MDAQEDPLATRLSIHIPPPCDKDSDSDSDATMELDGATPLTLTPSGAFPSTKPRELAPFLRQLREMLDHEAPSILRWTPDGRAFEILDLHQMTYVVLPKYFKHAKYASFQRQLNYFHFRKWTKSKSPRCTFANPHFVREAPELTWRITRKRDASQRQKLKRQRARAQSFDPQAHPRPVASLDAQHATSASRDRAVSESQVAYDDDDGAQLRTADSALAGADDLLQWIDDHFPSIASLELLDDMPDMKPPVWTPYTYQHQHHPMQYEHPDQQAPGSPVALYLRTPSSV